MKLSQIAKLIIEAEDDKYVHIGYGKYKEKGKEDDEKAPVFNKTDSGKYVKSADAEKGDDSEKDSGAKLGGGDFERDGGDDKPKYEPSPDDYDSIYGTRSQSGKWQKPRGDDDADDMKSQAAQDDKDAEDDLDNAFDHKGGGKLRQIAFKKDGDQKDKLSKIADELDDLKFKYYDERSMSRDRYDNQVNRLKGEAEEALSGGAPKADAPSEDAGIKPIKADADTKRMGDSIQRKIGGSKDPDRLELQGTQEASNGETIIQWKDEDGSMVGVDAQGNIYEDGEKQNYGVDVSTQSDVFGDDQNAQLAYKQKSKDSGDSNINLPSADDYDSVYGTRSQSGKWNKPRKPSPLAQDKIDKLKARQAANDPDDMGPLTKKRKEKEKEKKKGFLSKMFGKKESITFNGKQYSPIKESKKKSNPRILKENYDRIFRSRK